MTAWIHGYMDMYRLHTWNEYGSISLLGMNMEAKDAYMLSPIIVESGM